MINRKFTSRSTRNSDQQAARRGRRSLFLQHLESRHMLTSIGLDDDGLVEVQGSEGADNISVLVAEGRFVVEVNGVSISFNNEDVDGLYVEAKGGDDFVNIDSTVLQPTLVFGGMGNDTILGGAGVDNILGGSGNDPIYGNVANDILLGDGPNSLAEVPLPHPGDPALPIAADAQVITDLATVDPDDPDTDPLALYRFLSRISGINSGRDTIVGGTGHDMIFAGAQGDNVTGDGPNVPPGTVPPVEIWEVASAAGTISLDFAVAETDIIPLPANDYIEAGSGDDIVSSGPGDDLVLGGGGNDMLTTGIGADIVGGGSGDDTISSGGGRDRVLGDGPNTINQVILGAVDVYLANSALGAGNDIIEAGDGNDQVYAGDTSGSAVNLVFGGSGDDTIFGGRGRDAIVGGAGDDTIRSGASADIVLGDSVNSLSELPVPQPGEPVAVDLIAAATPVTDIAPIDPYQPDPLALHRYLSRISGINSGNDTIVAGTGNDLVFAGAARDSVQGDGPNVYPLVVPIAEVTAASIEGFATVQLEIVAPPNNDYIEGGGGNDRVDGGDGNNIVLGGTGADTLIGGAGADIVVGGSGRDMIRTHGGADTVLGDGPATINQVILSADDVYLANSRLGHGNDYIESGGGNDTVYAGRGRDAVFAGAGDDFAHGGRGDDLMFGGAGNDLMFGGDGDDLIDGGAGNDLMFGDAGNDIIFGRSGNDLLHGGHGDDELHDDLNSGGDGIDLFIGGCGADKIFANDGQGGPVDFVFYDDDDELHVDGEDLLIKLPPC